MAEVTYFVALPFIATDDGLAPGEAVECLSANAMVAIEQFLRQSIAYNTDIRPKDKLMPRAR